MSALVVLKPTSSLGKRGELIADLRRDHPRISG